MNMTEAVTKAVKLLRLSQSSNPNEAALAMSKAQEIIDRYKLGADTIEYATKENTSTVNPDEPIKDFGTDPLEEVGTSGRWRSWLALAIAKQNQCRVYLRAGRICLVGQPSSVSTVRYLFAWLVREIDRLAAAECQGNGRTYMNNFRIGAVEAVSKKLEEQHATTIREVKAQAEASSNEYALVHINQSIAKIEATTQAVDAYVKQNLRLRSAGSSRTTFDSGAREHGRKAGSTINIRASRGNVTGGYASLAA